jgi:hypothetical protein
MKKIKGGDALSGRTIINYPSINPTMKESLTGGVKK